MQTGRLTATLMVKLTTTQKPIVRHSLRLTVMLTEIWTVKSMNFPMQTAKHSGISMVKSTLTLTLIVTLMEMSMLIVISMAMSTPKPISMAMYLQKPILTDLYLNLG